MRTSRMLAPDGRPGIYHVFNRIANTAMLFTDNEKDRFLRILRNVAKFCGVEILTFCVMTDHFHVLVRVPERKSVDNAELLERIALIQTPSAVRRRMKRWERLETAGQAEVADAERDAIRARMYDLSGFAKTLKELFSAQYNKRTGHVGTLWAGRFGSVYIADNYNALMSVASYIDFNPVKARMTESPLGYRWNGITSAPANIVNLVRIARGDTDCGDCPRGMRHLTDPECLELYKNALSGRLANPASGTTVNAPAPEKPTKASIERKLAGKEPLSFLEMLYCHVALFSREPAIGSFSALGTLRRNGKDRRVILQAVLGVAFAAFRPLRGIVIRAG